jgi:hypothetical protein
MLHLKIRQWPMEGFIHYSCQENLTHLPYTPRTQYPLPNTYLLACREKLRGLSACSLYSSPGLFVAVWQWCATIGETHLPCYVFSFVEIPRWQRSPCYWRASPQFSGKKSRRDYKKASLKTYCIPICYYNCSTSRGAQKTVVFYVILLFNHKETTRGTHTSFLTTFINRSKIFCVISIIIHSKKLRIYFRQ